MLVQTKPRRCRVKACALTADISSALPAILWAPHFVRAVGCLQRFVPSHIHMELVMHKIDLASYALTTGRTFGSPESVWLARGREPRAFACPIGINAGMQFITKSVSRSVQILDLYPRLASTDRVSERKIRGRIFRPANTWCNNLFIFTETL